MKWKCKIGWHCWHVDSVNDSIVHRDKRDCGKEREGVVIKCSCCFCDKLRFTIIETNSIPATKMWIEKILKENIK